MNYGVNNMEYICIGKIVNTHGIKGEIRILSEFPYKSLVFKQNFTVYIGKEKIKQTIQSYRHHKIFDMITLQGISDINDVLQYKGSYIYIDKSSLNVIYDEDYIGLEVYTDHYIGVVTDIIKNYQSIFIVKNQEKKYLIPNVKEFIDKVDFEQRKIYIHEIKGLLDEN